jgi:hypothetical protein
MSPNLAPRAPQRLPDQRRAAATFSSVRDPALGKVLHSAFTRH